MAKMMHCTYISICNKNIKGKGDENICQKPMSKIHILQGWYAL